jgi:hypothetical protein
MHFDNWLFLLLVAVALLFRWLTSAASKATKNSGDTEPRSTSTPPPVPRVPVDADEERIRKFLEALGQPPESRPPRPVAPQRPTYQKPVVLPHVPPFASPLPPLTTRPPDLPREVKLPGQITEPPYEKKTFKPKAAAATFEVHEATAAAPSGPSAPIKSPAEAYAIATQPKTVPATRETNIVALLRSPSGLRNAIILREIFGPPRSLQDVDLLGGA